MTNEMTIEVIEKIKKRLLPSMEEEKEALDMAIKALKQQYGWIPIITRPLTEEEKEEHPDAIFIYDCHMPDDGEEVFVSTKWGVSTDTYCAEPDGCYFENYCDEGDVLAWQPFPKPYEGGKDQ